jgi:hypothetical protein
LAANDPGDRNWIKHLPSVLHHANEKKVVGAPKFKRSEVTKANELQVLAAKMGAKDCVPLINTRLIRCMSERTRKLLNFKFKKNDKVLLAASSSYETVARLARSEGKFTKSSVAGDYDPTVRVVKDAFLKANKTHYVHCYELYNLEDVYYTNELVSAAFAGTGEEAEQRQAARQAAREAKLRAAAAKKRAKRRAERWK